MWKPTYISGCQLWFDANKIIGLNDGDKVSLWLDMSGNNYNASQSVDSYKPLYKINQICKNSAVIFDGIDDVLDISTFIPNGLTGMSMFIVSACLTDFKGTNYTIAYLKPVINWPYSGSDGSVCVAPRQSNVYSRFSGGDFGYDRIVSKGSAFTLISTLKNGTNQYIYDNGILLSNLPNGNATILNTNSTGHIGYGGSDGGYGNYNVAEIIVYNNYLSDSNRRLVEAYLSEKYFIKPQQSQYGTSIVNSLSRSLERL